MKLQAPFPYFGGKSMVAHIVWQALGDCKAYYEPFFDLVSNMSDLSYQSYASLMEKLIETYPDMDTSAIEALLSRAIFISELWGRLDG